MTKYKIRFRKNIKMLKPSQLIGLCLALMVGNTVIRGAEQILNTTINATTNTTNLVGGIREVSGMFRGMTIIIIGLFITNFLISNIKIEITRGKNETDTN